MTKDNPDWLEEIGQINRELLHASWDVDSLARSFERIGNDAIANELSEYARIMRDSSTGVGNAIGRMLNKEVTKGQKEIAEIFKVLIVAKE